MLRYIASRLLQTIPLVFLATIIIFLMMRMIPGDAANLYAGPLATQEDIELLRKQFGLDRPLPVQYGIWMGNLLQGDMGESILSKQPVSSLLIQRFPATLELATAAMIVTVFVGVTSGLLAATHSGSKVDGLITSLVGINVAAPSFWIGILAIFLFAQLLGWLPPGGRVAMTSDPIEALRHLLMPAVVLASTPAATLSRLVKGSTLEVLNEDYVRTAHAKGLRAKDVLMRHVLRNALVPVVTVIGLQFGRLLGGAIIVESVFVWPGLGRLLLFAVNGRDYAIVQGGLVMLVFIFVVINLITDILYGMIDPRIRVGRAGS